jgi:hypothetical protein
MKPMPKRQVAAALARQGCRKTGDSGKHEKWDARWESRQHLSSLPRHDEITAGVVRNLIRDLKCLPEGWLQ